MGSISVAQAAERLGVSVPRIHQRIADGSLVAERIGSQWAVDERSLLRVQERSKPGRPHSARSAWAVIAVSEKDRDRMRPRGPAAWARARMQLKRLLEPAERPASAEDAVGDLAVSLRSVFRNRAQRRLLRAAPADLADLRADDRWAMLVDLGAIGIASADVEGYLAESEVAGVMRDFLLVEADSHANVVLHVILDAQYPYPYPDSRLRLAADLAEHRGPREEARAPELLRLLAGPARPARAAPRGLETDRRTARPSALRERGQLPVRPTNEADTAAGLEHRWMRGEASIDVLLPDGIGERARVRLGATGSPTLPTAGGTQALQRSETIAVMVGGREGSVRRPHLGALVGKAAALSNAGDPGLGRHRRDFVILAGLLTARDFRARSSPRRTASGCAR
ncbi:MAG: hypothetical protein JWO76_1866 [Nocardioides sp.]|nr:hypothetical protein [Nocardioides sp.]